MDPKEAFSQYGKSQFMDPKEAFSQYGKAPVIPEIVFWIIIIIVICGILLFLLKKYTQSKINQMTELVRFKSYAIECNIEDQLMTTLTLMTDSQLLKDPIQVLKSTEVFDRVSNTYMKTLLEKGLKAGEYEEILIQITKIRTRVAARVKEQFKPITSTADLGSGLELQLEVKSGLFAGIYDSSIASGGANNLVVHSPSLNGKKIFFELGLPVNFTFSREDDAVYQFTTKVVGKYQGSLAAILFQNTDQIVISHIRKYTRISPDFLIKVTGVLAPKGDIHHIDSLKSESVNIIDISGGGMQIKVLPEGKLKNYLEKGKVLSFSLYIPNIGPVEELKGRIIRTDYIKEKGYVICSMEFFAISSKNRCRLLQGILVFLSKNN